MWCEPSALDRSFLNDRRFVAARVSVPTMNWDRLFAELEGEFEAGMKLRARLELAEQTRAERATVSLPDRVRASIGARVALVVCAPSACSTAVVEGTVTQATVRWVVVTEGQTSFTVPMSSIQSAQGLNRRAAPAAGPVENGLGLGHVARHLAETLSPVEILVAGAVYRGRIEDVGADHLDLTDGTHSWALPFAALAYIRSPKW